MGSEEAAAPHRNILKVALSPASNPLAAGLPRTFKQQGRKVVHPPTGGKCGRPADAEKWGAQLAFRSAGAAIRKHHRLGACTAEIGRLSSGGWKSKIKVLAEPVPPEAARGESVPGLSPTLRGFPATFGLPWFINASPLSLATASHGFSSCGPVCAQIFPFYENTSHIGFRTQLPLV